MSNSFLQCVSNICGLEMATLIGDYKYSVFGGHTVVVEGHKSLVDYTAEKVSFALNRGILHIHGTDLRIKCMEKGFAVVTGNLLSTEVCNEK